MPGKRKRKGPRGEEIKPNKRLKVLNSAQMKENIVRCSLLSQYYTEVLTLREYLLSKLPTSSKTRRKKIISIGRIGAPIRLPKAADADELKLASLIRVLDHTLVGVSATTVQNIPEDHLKQWNTFSQRMDVSETIRDNSTLEAHCSQSEVCFN